MLDQADGRSKVLSALAERKSLDALLVGLAGLGVDPRHLVLDAEALAWLAGELAAVQGDEAAAIERLKEAVRLEDALNYDEPPPWHYPVRQSLGAVLLEAGKAAEAEQVYREDLRRHPKNGWSLFGLARSLHAQGNTDEARQVEEHFEKAWTHADVTLHHSRF